MGKWPQRLKGGTLAACAARGENTLDRLVAWPRRSSLRSGAEHADQGSANEFLRLHDRPGDAGHLQHLRVGNPPLGGLPRGHQRPPVRLQRPDPRRISLSRRHRPPQWPACKEGPPQCHRREFRRRLIRSPAANQVSNRPTAEPDPSGSGISNCLNLPLHFI